MAGEGESLTDIIKIADSTQYTAISDARLKAVIGGTTDYFAPSVNFSYEFESGAEKLFLNICDDPDQVDASKVTETLTDGKIVVKDKGVESSFQMIDGRLKINRKFDAKPTVAPRYRVVQSAGISWYYQPILTQDEIDDGCIRPDNIVGSYAIYCDRQGHYKNNKGTTDVNYTTGKLCHLYAPYWIDAKDKKVKGVQEYKDGWLTFALPDSKWLDDAVLPITLDPEFGYHTVGGTQQTYLSNYIYLISGTPASSGTVDSIFTYTKDNGTDAFKCALYDGDGNPNNYIDKTAEVTKNALTWVQADFGTPPSVTGGNEYWLAVFSAGGNVVGYYDAGSNRYLGNQTYDTFPDPWVSDINRNRRGSIYAEYTAAGGGVTMPIFMSNYLRQMRS